MCSPSLGVGQRHKRALFDAVDAVDMLSNVRAAYIALEELLEPRTSDERLLINSLNLFCLIGCLNTRLTADLDLAALAVKVAAGEASPVGAMPMPGPGM